MWLANREAEDRISEGRNRGYAYKGVDPFGLYHVQDEGCSEVWHGKLEKLKGQILEHPTAAIEEFLTSLNEWKLAPHALAEHLRAAKYGFEMCGKHEEGRCLGEAIKVMKEKGKAPFIPIPFRKTGIVTSAISP
jgi:hypothetical protein